MQTFFPAIDNEQKRPVYLQLYDHIKQEILNGGLLPDQKLPSLRSLSRSLGYSITTIELAYAQLQVEGYIYSKPQSGYFAHSIDFNSMLAAGASLKEAESPLFPADDLAFLSAENAGLSGGDHFLYDLSCFDFIKWKKCSNRILNEYPHLLLQEGMAQGEPALRGEVSRYLYQARGVRCTPEQVVIAAGTQQITSLIGVMLQQMSIDKAVIEEPGYLPVQKILSERGFQLIPVPVGTNGIRIDALPTGQRACAYVSPSNQFPTGAVMPIGCRYELLSWASQYDCIIIEDDYDSELRYFGRPIPSLQGLDQQGRVVYLGSFSSTLFPAIRISYMVVPVTMQKYLSHTIGSYAQTCSKAEQLTLALYMEQGLYQIHIKKLRKLYAQKLQQSVTAILRHMVDIAKPLNSSSGIHLLLEVRSQSEPQELCRLASTVGLKMTPHRSTPRHAILIFYYNQIPLGRIDFAVAKLAAVWSDMISHNNQKRM